MAKYCGIDEAGLGPILGPLSTASCEVDFAPEKLYQVLAELWPSTWSQPIVDGANGTSGATSSNTKATREFGKKRLAERPLEKRQLADSKQIFRKSTDFAKLEQIALSVYLASTVSGQFLSKFSAEGLPAAALFSEGERRQIEECPWYRQILRESLPLSAETAERGKIGANAQHLIGQNSGKNIRISGALLCEKRYNQSIAELDNKSLVLRKLIGRLIWNFANSVNAGNARERKGSECVVDRLGGLRYYRPWLEELLGQRQGQLQEALVSRVPRVSTVCEEQHRSEYQISQNGSSFGLSFVVKGDQKNILCALASIWAKYRRELLMRSFNQYWSSRGVSNRTSGYYQDAIRFLSELQELFGELPKDLRRSR